MASDEDYGHVARKNKDLGVQVTPSHTGFGHYLHKDYRKVVRMQSKMAIHSFESVHSVGYVLTTFPE